MITKNFYDTIANKLYGISLPRATSQRVSAGGTPYSSVPDNARDYSLMNNPLNELMATKANTADLYEKSNNRTVGYVFGTGNAAPTVDDFKLSGEMIDSSKIAVTQLSTFEREETAVKLTMEYTIANNDSKAITIGEVGLFDYFHYATGSGSSYQYYYPMLVERTALENPITIEAGGVGKVTYSIRINNPTQ